MYEIDPKKAGYDEIEQYVMNMLAFGANAYLDDADRRMRLAYFGAMTEVILARKSSDSLRQLGNEIDAARSGLAKGLDKLTIALNEGSNASSAAAAKADQQAGRMVWATWALVGVTLLLGLATIGLVVFTRALVLVEAAASH